MPLSRYLVCFGAKKVEFHLSVLLYFRPKTIPLLHFASKIFPISTFSEMNLFQRAFSRLDKKNQLSFVMIIASFHHQKWPFGFVKDLADLNLATGARIGAGQHFWLALVWVQLANEQLRLACLRCERGKKECHGPSFLSHPCWLSNLVSTRCACLSHDSNPKLIHRSKTSIFELCLSALDSPSYSFQIRCLSASFELITDTLVDCSTTLTLQLLIFAELVELVQLSGSTRLCPYF